MTFVWAVTSLLKLENHKKRRPCKTCFAACLKNVCTGRVTHLCHELSIRSKLIIFLQLQTHRTLVSIPLKGSMNYTVKLVIRGHPLPFVHQSVSMFECYMKSLDRLLFMDGSVSLNIFLEEKKKEYRYVVQIIC